MYKKLQVRFDEIKNDFKSRALKECERKLKELKKDIYLVNYLVSYDVGTTVVVNGGNVCLNCQEGMSEKELKYEIDKLEKDIENGILPVEYDLSGKKLNEIILINAKKKQITKEKLSELLNLFGELEENSNISLKLDKDKIDKLRTFNEKNINEILQEYK